MSGYTITITADSAEEHTPITAPQTTIKVDTSSGEARITEVTIRTTAPSGLPAGTASVLDVVDLDLLIHALTSGTRKPTSTPSSSVTKEPTTTLHSQQAEGKTDGAPSAPVRKISAKRSDRLYRRMPDTAEVLAVHERIGTIS